MTSKGCAAPAKLGMRDGSHVIAKLKPKIRIVHIFAPEIIKTDPANFRELVQRLTGKPMKGVGGKAKARPVTAADPKVKPSCTKLVEGVKREREREDGRLWESSGGFLASLGDIDGFLQGLGDFPLVPLSSSHMDLVGAHMSLNESLLK